MTNSDNHNERYNYGDVTCSESYTITTHKGQVVDVCTCNQCNKLDFLPKITDPITGIEVRILKSLS